MAVLRLSCLAAAAALVLGAAAPAGATVLYAQPGDGSACNPSCWTSSYGTDGQGADYQGYDDFTLSKSGSVTTVQWQGFYLNYANFGANPVAPPTQSWNLSFSSNASGLPGSALYSTSLLASQVTVTPLGPDYFYAPVEVYSFTATLPTAFAASANTTYWFSPLSVQPDGSTIFSWSASTITADGYSAQASPAGGAPYSTQYDRAFTLSGAVPEPATWAMLILGLGLVGVAARRRHGLAVA